MDYYLQKHDFIFHACWAIILFTLTKFIAGFYYEAYELMFPAIFSGEFLGGQPGNIFYLVCHVGLANIYTSLYTLFPALPWYDLFMSAFMLLSVWVIFFCVHFLFRNSLRQIQIILLNTFIYLVFMGDSGINWNYTRVSLLLCGASFIWYVVLLLPQTYSRQTILPLFSNSLLFTLGTLIRPEAGVLMFVFIAIYSLCYTGLKKSLVLKLLPFFIPVAVLISANLYDRLTTNEYYKKVLHTNIEYQIALGNVVNIDSMRTEQDSMKYIALRAGIVNDPQYITYNFMQSIVRNKNAFFFDEKLFLRACYLLKRGVTSYYYLIVFNVLLLAVGAFCLIQRKVVLLRFLLYNLLFASLLFLIAYTMTMENHILSPLLIFFSAGNFMLLRGYGFFCDTKNKIFNRYVMLVVVVFMSIGSTIHLYETRVRNEAESLLHKKRYAELVNQAGGKNLVTDNQAIMELIFAHGQPFKHPDFGDFKNLFLMDFETYTLTPAYRSYLDKNCRCNSTDLGEFFDYLYSQKNNFVFVGNPQRVKLFESYLRVVRGKKYSFQHLNDLYTSSNHYSNGTFHDKRMSIFGFR